MFPATPPSQRIGSIILAAGASERMGRPKALLNLPDGRSFLEAILSTHAALNRRPVVVVGADAEQIEKSVGLQACWVTNPHPQAGPLSSLLLALDVLAETRAVTVHAVDHPLVRAETLLRLAAAHRRLPACILVPEYCGRKGHPVLFPARFYADLREAPLDIGARAVVRSNIAAVHRVPVDDPGIIRNINTPDAYADHVTGWARLPSPRVAASPADS